MFLVLYSIDPATKDRAFICPLEQEKCNIINRRNNISV